MQSLPVIKIQDEVVTSLPKDLYIPKDALCVLLDAFSGPLDVLLYLIKKQNIDILNIPISAITDQYVAYVELMYKQNLELTADYLVMASILAEIKSRMLLPKPVTESTEPEEDPRVALVKRLQAYAYFKEVAEALDMLPRQGRDIFDAHVGYALEQPRVRPKPPVVLRDLLDAWQSVLSYAQLRPTHQIKHEPLQVGDRMGQITDLLQSLNRQHHMGFHNFLVYREGRLGVVVTFLALLQLAQNTHVDLQQDEPFDPLLVKLAG